MPARTHLLAIPRGIYPTAMAPPFYHLGPLKDDASLGFPDTFDRGEKGFLHDALYGDAQLLSITRQGTRIWWGSFQDHDSLLSLRSTTFYARWSKNCRSFEIIGSGMPARPTLPRESSCGRRSCYSCATLRPLARSRVTVFIRRGSSVQFITSAGSAGTGRLKPAGARTYEPIRIVRP